MAYSSRRGDPLPTLILPQVEAHSDWRQWAHLMIVALEQYDAEVRAVLEPLVATASTEDQQLVDIVNAN